MESIDKLLKTLEKIGECLDEARRGLYDIYREVGCTTIEEYSEKRNVTLTLQQLRWVINMATEICKEQEEPERLIPIAGKGLHYLFPEYALDWAFEECGINIIDNITQENDQVHTLIEQDPEIRTFTFESQQ